MISDLFLHGKELTSETLRGLSLSRLVARATAAGQPMESDASDDELTVAELRARGLKLAEQRRDERSAGIVRGKLRRPDGTDPDGFYRLVASAYGQYAAETNAPARALADEADVPVTTAHR